MNLTEMLGSSSGASSETMVWLYTRLKECYELIIDSADSNEVRALAKQRFDNLTAIGDGFFDIDLTDTGNTVQSSISLIREALSIEEDNAPLNSGFSRQSEINALPESSEKQYVFALLSLRSNTGNFGCLNALRYLENAISQEPANIVYRTLAETIHDAIE